MRGIFLLLGISIALLTSSARAGGDGKTVKCDKDDVVCLVIVNVDMTGGKCKAVAPTEVMVPRAFFSTWLLFVLVGGDDDKVSFATSEAIKPHKPSGTLGTPWRSRFDDPIRRHKRQLLVKDWNSVGTSDEAFEYDLVVMYGSDTCEFPDPLIHNTN